MKHLQSIKHFTLLFIFTLLVSCSKNTEEVRLRLNHTVGDKFTMTSSTVAKSGSLMSLDNYIEVDFKIVDFNDDVYTMSSLLVRIKSETIMGKDVERYDSDKKKSLMSSEERSMHRDFEKDFNTTYNILINTKGEITKPFHTASGIMIDAPIIAVSQFQMKFPEQKVNVGTSWTGENVNSFTKQTIKSVYTVKDITETEITISVKSTIPEFAGLLKQNETKGTYVLDKKTCQLMKATFKMDMQVGGQTVYSYVRK